MPRRRTSGEPPRQPTRDDADYPDPIVYSLGLVHASACAPVSMTGAEVAARVNEIHPTQIRSAWEISDAAVFSCGTSNPCECNDHPGQRRHWLLVC